MLPISEFLFHQSLWNEFCIIFKYKTIFSLQLFGDSFGYSKKFVKDIILTSQENINYKSLATLNFPTILKLFYYKIVVWLSKTRTLKNNISFSLNCHTHRVKSISITYRV